MSEARVHFDFYHHLQNAIDDTPQRGARTYERVEPEYSQDIDGRADLVVFDTDEPVVVIEAKRPDGTSGREIDPYSPVVIRQAHGYASELGSPFFATYNGERLVLFNTHEQGVPLLRRSTKSYDIGNVEAFADTLLDEIVRLEAGRTQWDSLDDAFIERVRSLHEQLTPEYLAALSDQLEHAEFHESFVEWASAQGLEYDDMNQSEQQEVRERFAEEGAYLLANKLIFYKILESAPAYASEVRPLAIRESHARDDLETYFEEIVTNIDFEAVFEHDEIFSEIPLLRAGKRISEFIDELDDQDLTQFDSDVIGRIYEGVIPAERRHDLGEYYTPPAICDLITRLTIRDAADQVLDPACGSGGFPVSAYNRKRDLLAEPAGSHDRLLEDIYGIDINRFPAHLTAINLAIQDLSSHTENVNVEVSDFFNVNPDTVRFGRTAASASGDEYEHNITDTLGDFDAVVGNPPYIRGRNIPFEQKDRARNHLSSAGASFSKRMDIYGYFLSHSTEFLDNGGRLGFITSDRWLDTAYGAELQKFVLENYCIEAIIKFDQQAFEDALIGSTVLILSREDNPEQRDEHTAKFLRIKEPLEIEDIAELVEDDYPPDQLVRTPGYRLVTREQRELYAEDKWNVFFIAPAIYFDLLGHEGTTELSETADLSRGLTTGANAFFYARNDEWEELGLESYTQPLLKASGQIGRIHVDNAFDEWGVIDVHRLVSEALSDVREQYADFDENQAVKQRLAENGHKEFIEYVEWGEDEEYHDRPTTAARTVWFDLGDLDQPEMLMPDFTWRIHRVAWNHLHAVADRQFYNIDSGTEIDPRVLCGILNSRLVWLMCELQGRWAKGQAMTRSEIKVYEAKQLTIPDPRLLSEGTCDEIKEAFDNLLQREIETGDDPDLSETESERDTLDRMILRAMGIEERFAEVKQAVSDLLTMRENEAGRTQVLVNRVEEREVIDLAGVSESRESTTLGDFDQA